jgi:hypothetical protein
MSGTFPDGIDSGHVTGASGSLLSRWPFGLAGLGIVLFLAIAGVFGANTSITGGDDQVSLQIEGPKRIRNGSFYEMVVTIDSRRDIPELVLLVDQAIWYQVTVNTLYPEPKDYGFEDGAFSFRYGKLPANQSLVVKVDAQINSGRSPSTNLGKISIADNDTVIAAAEYAMEVLP